MTIVTDVEAKLDRFSSHSRKVKQEVVIEGRSWIWLGPTAGHTKVCQDGRVKGAKEWPASHVGWAASSMKSGELVSLVEKTWLRIHTNGYSWHKYISCIFYSLKKYLFC